MRTTFKKLVLLVLLTSVFAGYIAVDRDLSAREKPNVIIIFTDDQGYEDVGVFGSPDIDTPNLDQMAEEGMKFTDFYSVASVCAPSRAGLMTGRYPPRVAGGKKFKNPFPRHNHGLHPQEITMAEMLNETGYATACVGKWHLGHLPKFLPTNQGFDRYYGIPYSNDMKGGNHRGGLPLAKDVRWRKGASPDNIQVKKGWVPLMRDEKVIEYPVNQHTLTRRYTKEAIDFINDNRDRPFFLYLAHTMPHVPIHVSSEFRGTSGDLYGDAIEEIDWGVGKIISRLQQLGIDDNTLIVYSSDNGPWLRSGTFGDAVDKNEEGSADPLRGGKFSDYEGGFRVPTLMRWPDKIPAGTVCDEVAATIDLLPTIAGLAGASLPGDRVIDGKDIRPLMAGEEGARSPHKAFYYYSGKRLTSIRSGKWKLHEDELYNLVTDIGETNDLSDERPEIVDRLNQMKERFDQELKRNVRPIGTAGN